MGQTCLLALRFRSFWMVEKLYGICARVAGDGDECIQHEDFACARCCLIAECHLLHQFPPCLRAQC